MDGINIRTGDFRELAATLDSGSVALILTDPEYKNIDDYADLARVAARVLQPDGACLAFCENTLLHDCLTAMTPHLEFVRTLNIFMSGVTVGRHVGRLFVKTTPCLWLGLGNTQPKRRVWDISVGVSNRRKNGQYHQWSKDPTTIERWVLAFSNPGDLVLDPFLGGGTVAVACMQTGRRCIGYEIDPEVADVARRRLANAQPALFVPPVAETRVMPLVDLGNNSDEQSDNCSLSDEPGNGGPVLGIQDKCVALPAGVPRGAHIEEKMINNCGPYRYARWRENGRLRSKYLGKVAAE